MRSLPSGRLKGVLVKSTPEYSRDSTVRARHLKAEMATQKIAPFLDRLGAVGKVTPNDNAPDLPEGMVTVSIQIVTQP